MSPTLFYGTAIFGTPTIPSFTEAENVSKMLDQVHSLGITELDTAARYPPDNVGESERLLGATKACSGFTINTKVLIAGASGDGTLTKDAIRVSVAKSLKTLGVSKIGILYAHAPDNTTPLEEQAEAFNEQYKKGHCERIGVSNFPPAMLEKFLSICDEHNYVKPSIYQGEYNLVRREAEDTLFPLLRKHKIHFVAFSPLGGGFLTGKFTAGNAEGTRFGGPLGQRHRLLYDKPDFHKTINELKRIIEPLGISPTGAALRWLTYHSELDEEDGIILGASKIEQLEQNVKDIKQGPLPESVIEAIRAIKGATAEP